MNRTRSVARSAVSGWLNLAINVPATLLITPFIVRTLNQELYGTWSFLNGLLMYTDLLYFGLGSAVVTHVAQCRVRGDVAGIARLISVVTTIYGTLGVVCMVLLIWLGFALPGMRDPLSPAAAQQVALTCTLLGVQMFVVFVGSAFSGLISGYDRFDLVNSANIVIVILRTLATLLVVREGGDSMVRLAMVTCGSAALFSTVLIFMGFRLIRGVSIRPVAPRTEELRYLYGFGLQSFFVIFAVRLISNTDTTVIFFALGALSVGLYSPPLMLLEQARSAVAAFTSVLLPSVTTLTATERLAELRDFYVSTTRVTCFMAAWLAATAICLGPAFLGRWLGPEFGQPVRWVVFCLALTMFCQNISIGGPLAFYQSLHILRVPALVLFAEALLNLALSIWLAPRMGITGVALATVLPTLFLSTAILPPYLCRHLGLPLRQFLVEVIQPGLLVLVVVLASEWIAGLIVSSESYGGMGLRAIMSLPGAFLVFRATFPKDQQRAVWQMVGLARAR